MKKLLYSILLFTSVILFGQKNKNVKFAICNDVLGTVDMFESYKKQIESTVLFKADKLPQHLKKFNFLAESGLTEIKLKKNYGTPDILSLENFNEQNSLAKDTPVNIDGFIVNDTTTKIYSEIIKDSEVRVEDGKKYIFISTFNK